MSDIEVERYELFGPPPYRFDFDRRNFCKTLGGGLVVLLLLDAASAQEPASGRRRAGGAAPRQISAWLHVGADGQITVFTGKVEVGQNIRTSLSQVVAEELRVPLSAIRLVMADTQLTPFDAGTFGSRTTPDMARQLRLAAAAAREALMDLAAEVWNADRAQLTVAGGRISLRSPRKTISYGKLTKGQQLTRAVSANVPITPVEQWSVAGRSAAKVNGRDFVTGRHLFTSDLRLPNMLHGKVLRPPALGATLLSCDTSGAEAVPGAVVVRDGDFVGVAAPTEQQAQHALAAIRAAWRRTPQISQTELFQHLKNTAAPAGGGRGGAQRLGAIAEGMAAADLRLEASYTIAYIAHAPLEPRAALAQWENGALTVWTGTQRPFGVRGELAQAFRLPEEKVRVLTPDTGSGYGGKHTGEAAVEAARLAKAAGRPVKLVWTREEEFHWAYFRPAGVIEIQSGVRRDGTLTAWEFHNINSGGSALRMPYEVPHQWTEFHPARSPLRQGSYRALAATANHFARECHMDDLARAVGIDPLEFRRKNLKDARLRAVLDAAAERFGWGRQPAVHCGFGIAGGFEKGSYVATCAEVEVDRANGRVRVLRAVTAFECGAILNPDHLRNQIEGSVVMGLGGALFEAIHFADGRILNASFRRYRVPRFSDTPQLETVLLDRKDLPSAGAGETPIVAIAPAIGNAICAATGVRLRSLPMATETLKV